MAAVKTPAERLMGLELVDGWKVIEEVAKPPGFTGGNFSCGYIVRGEDGRKAYVKALDLTPPFGQQGDWTLILRGLLDGYEHERQLCRQCRKMSRVVNVLADGDIMVDPNDPLTRVPYLVFELADSDVRSEFEALKNAAKTFEIAWALRSLHHVATGLWQLHQRQIVHQDLKPSNILVFDQEGSKVTDLGRSAAKAMRSPNDDEDVPCDRTYAPPELAFGWVAPEWNTRRFGCDAYLLGSMVVFYFARVAMTPLLLDCLAPSYRPKILRGPYRGDYATALPYVKDAFAAALGRFSSEVPDDLRDEVTEIVAQLCEPDPSLRGDPRSRGGGRNQYSMERYVSRFNLLARRAELKLVGKV